MSTVRWLVVDTLHHRTGIRPPPWNFGLLTENVAAFGVLVDIHYRYYQFYSNSLISLTWVYLTRRASMGFWSTPFGVADVGFVLLGGVFFLGSRDTLRKYYLRTAQLLGTLPRTQSRGKGKSVPRGR